MSETFPKFQNDLIQKVKAQSPGIRVRRGGSYLFSWLTVAAVFAVGVGWFVWMKIPRHEALPPLEIMTAQMLLIGFTGATADDPGAQILAGQILERKVGGVITLGLNFKTREGITGITRLFREAAGSQPVFIAVDQEGGKVQRLGPKLGYEAIPSATQISETMTPEQARPLFEKMTSMVKEAGFNVNLAPVVDLGLEIQNPAVGKTMRTYDKSASRVVDYARVFVNVMQAQHVLPVLKHYPGHGSARSDTHNDLVDISDTWSNEELTPFRELVSMRQPLGIMTGHLVLRSLAPEGGAVTFSNTAINGTLRGQLKFDGLVISDDLQMAAVLKHQNLEDAVVLAINAGVDVIMISNSNQDPQMPEKMIMTICKAVNEGLIPRAKIESAWRRIMKAKAWLAQ